MNFIHNVHNLAYNLILYAVILSSTIHPGPRSASAQNEDPVREEITAMILHDARPMQFLEEKTGKPSGFAVDCMNIIAQRAGFSVTYTFGHDFSGLTEELKRGDVDVLPMFAVSEERRKDVDFTEPLDSTLSMLFVRAKDKSITELQAALNVGVVQGSVIDIQLQNRKDFSLIKYTGFTDALFDLLSAQIDGLAAPESIIWGMAIDAGVEDKISTAGQPLGEEISAMAVKKGNVRLLKKLNREIKEFVGSPEYQAIYEKWYAKKPPYFTPQKIFIMLLVLTSLSILSLAYWRYRSIVTLNSELLVNIDNRKKAEEALRESQHFYELLADNLPGIVCRVYVRDNNRLHFFNDLTKKITGYSSRELTGEVCSIEAITVPEDKEHVATTMEKALHGKEPFSIEYRIRHKNGSVRHLLEHGTPIYNADGKLQYIDRVMFDVTDRKKMAEELLKVQKLESVGILAGGIAHDFNNLLTSIVGNISLAKRYLNAGQESNKWLTGAEKAAERAADLTRQLLTFSKGGKPLRMTASIVEPLRESINFTLSGSRVLPEFSIPRDIWDVAADIGQISQVFNNLAINAMQAMPQGGKLNVAAHNVVLQENDIPALTEGRYVRITIRDTGMGIPPENLPKIFDPYFTTKESGNGLGLSTVFSIVKNHDGHIMVDSALSKGTSFSIYLPALELTAAAGGEEEEEKILTGSGRVLVMDDETIVQGIVGELLRSLGYKPNFASDGHEALSMYQKALQEGAPFDAVIMDLTIPGGMGGREAIQELLEMDPNARAIVSSGYSDDPVIAAYRNHGFKGALAKPYKLKVLSSTLRNVLDEGTTA